MFERQQQSQRHHLADHLAARQEKQPRPATGSSVGPSEADLKRREHLKEAKRRNEETRRQFSSRVKQYFAAGIEAERQKAEALLAVRQVICEVRLFVCVWCEAGYGGGRARGFKKL